MRYIVALFFFMMIFLAGRVLVALELLPFTLEEKDSQNKSVAFVQTSLDEEAKLQKTGKALYMVYCSSCHGVKGDGNNNKAQDHRKRISKDSVLYAIENGAHNFKASYSAAMPAGLLEKKEALEVARYIANDMRTEAPQAWKRCSGCHGLDARGIAFIAPDLKEYSDALIFTILQNGKKGVIGTMPSFADKLSDLQIKALAVYIRTLQE